MRWLINYLRQCFCKHDWENLGRHAYCPGDEAALPTKTIDVYRCKKCGYVQKIKL